MPQRPTEIDSAMRARTEPRYPYEIAAAALACQIDEGALPVDSFMPAAADLAADHGKSLSTAKRALALLRDWGLVARAGRNRLRGVACALPLRSEPARTLAENATPPQGEMLLDLVVRHRGEVVVAKFSAPADPRSADDLRSLLEDAIHRRGATETSIAEYEMDVWKAGKNELVTTFVASRRRRVQ